MEASNRNDVQEQLDRVGMSVKDLPTRMEILCNTESFNALCKRITDMMEASDMGNSLVFACHQTQAIDLLTQALKYACDQRDALVSMMSKSRCRCEFCARNENDPQYDKCSHERSYACHVGIINSWEENDQIRKIMLRKDMQPCSTQPILQM